MPPDEAPPVRARSLHPAISVALVLTLTSLGASLMCICGHMSWENLLALVPAAGYGWWWALRGTFALRALAVAPAIVALAANLSDVLWSGHEPLFAEPPAFTVIPPGVAVGGTLLVGFLISGYAAERARAQHE